MFVNVPMWLYTTYTYNIHYTCGSLHVQPIVISFFTGHVNWDANDSKIFITHSKQEGLRAPWLYMSWGMNHCWFETGKSRIHNESITLARGCVALWEMHRSCTAQHHVTDHRIPADVYEKSVSSNTQFCTGVYA